MEDIPSLTSAANPVSLLQIAAGLLLSASLLAQSALNFSPFTGLALAFLLALAGGWSFHKSAAKNLIWRDINADALISFSSWATFISISVTVLFPRLLPDSARTAATDILCALVLASSFGRRLAGAMEARGKRPLEKLFRLAPGTGRILDSSGEKVVPIEEIAEGAIAHVRPGEQIPLDGVVASGFSLVDERIIHNSTLPAEKSEGAAVAAGTVNKSDSLWLRAQKPGARSGIRIISDQILAKSKPGSRLFGFSEGAAAMILPFALISALTMAVIWAIDGPKPRAAWASAVLFSMLSAACPCALVLGEPLTILIGRRQADKSGIHFRRPGALAGMNRIDVILVGKTGVLTRGKPAVVKVAGDQAGMDQDSLCAILAVSERSPHPMAAAIASYARDAGARPAAVESFESDPGRGSTARIAGRTARLGSLPWLKSNGVSLPKTAIEGSVSAVGFAWGKSASLIFILEDQFREGAANAVSRLKKMGIETILACGDRNEIAYRAAETTGIARVFPETLPEEKTRLVERLQGEGKRVALLGQKFSDAAALCRADISLSAKPGSEVARDIADVVLDDADISRVALAFEAGKALRKASRRGIFWILGINALLLPAAAGILYPRFGLLIPEPLAAGVICAQVLALLANSSNIIKKETAA
ncbi:MAG: HAD-IC family P-type ATPase [Elusimicrobia bacterium]|nr:HAD-IC family P-type ATPase [Elusimicrobiota bacterium]MDE2313152.1 HAD-IC family P-type ATPase [Elusimicrobiota bacterium]